MGCTSSTKQQTKYRGSIISEIDLAFIINQYNSYYSQIQSMRFTLYDDLEIPHFLDLQQDLPTLMFDEAILWERLKQMKNIYSSHFYQDTCLILKEKLKNLKEIENKLFPFIKKSNKLIQNTKKENLSQKIESLIVEIELKRDCILSYFNCPQIEETCVTNILFRSSSIGLANQQVQTTCDIPIDFLNNAKVKPTNKKVSLELII